MRAAHYEETVARLTKDPIIRTMAHEVYMQPGLSREVDMVATLTEWRKRGGTGATHIGGPKEAVEAVMREFDVEGATVIQDAFAAALKKHE